MNSARRRSCNPYSVDALAESGEQRGAAFASAQDSRQHPQYRARAFPEGFGGGDDEIVARNKKSARTSGFGSWGLAVVSARISTSRPPFFGQKIPLPIA